MTHTLLIGRDTHPVHEVWHAPCARGVTLTLLIGHDTHPVHASLWHTGWLDSGVRSRSVGPGNPNSHRPLRMPPWMWARRLTAMIYTPVLVNSPCKEIACTLRVHCREAYKKVHNRRPTPSLCLQAGQVACGSTRSPPHKEICVHVCMCVCTALACPAELQAQQGAQGACACGRGRRRLRHCQPEARL